jgi:hypothetical protein
MDELGNVILKIRGPCCTWDGAFCPFESEFKVMTKDGVSQIGTIKKEYAGFVKELVSLADQFSITCNSVKLKFFLFSII